MLRDRHEKKGELTMGLVIIIAAGIVIIAAGIVLAVVIFANLYLILFVVAVLLLLWLAVVLLRPVFAFDHEDTPIRDYEQPPSRDELLVLERQNRERQEGLVREMDVDPKGRELREGLLRVWCAQQMSELQQRHEPERRTWED
jgi:uncharacterized protein (DUF58 family)